jgi:hypothetical protein
MNQEEVLIQLGIDARSMEQGTLKALAFQENSAAKTKAIWAEADRAREESYQASIEKMIADEERFKLARISVTQQIARAQKAAAEESAALQSTADAEMVAAGQSETATLIAQEEEYTAAYVASTQIQIAADIEHQAIRSALNKQWMAEQAAQIEIAKGSGGFGWAADAAGAAGGAAKAAHEVGNMRVVSREFLVIVREISRGNWGRVFGSVSIMLQSMGGVMSRLMQSVLGPFGISLAVIGTAAYALYKDIKNFSKGLDEVAKQNAESIGNATTAIKDATDAGIKSAAEYEAHIKSTANAHETLAEWAARSTAAIEKSTAAQEKLITSGANRKTAAINLAEHLGMMSSEAAQAARANVTVSTFNSVQTQKQDALVQEGFTLSAAYREAETRKGILEAQGRTAQAAVTGVDEHGNIVNHAAFDRNKRMKERENLQADVDKRNQQVADYEDPSVIDPLNMGAGAVGRVLSGVVSASTAGQFGGGTFDQGILGVHGNSVTKDDLEEGKKAIIAKEKELLKKREEQNKNDIAAQQAAAQSYKDAVKAIDENAASLKKLTEDMKSYAAKYKDQETALNALRNDLIAQSLNNESEQIHKLAGIDRANPTIEMLAGSGFMSRLNKAYGAGGIYDLESGKGPFAHDAQEYELSMKQQAADIEMGNAHFNEKGELDGGQAFFDQQNAQLFHNKLAAAGMETPEMQMRDLIEQGKAVQGEIKALNDLMTTNGIKIITDPTP